MIAHICASTFLASDGSHTFRFYSALLEKSKSEKCEKALCRRASPNISYPWKRKDKVACVTLCAQIDQIHMIQFMTYVIIVLLLFKSTHRTPQKTPKRTETS